MRRRRHRDLRLKLGGRDGIWLAPEIRRLYPHTAIVMATGQNDMDSVAASLRNDAVDYLLKPFDRRRLAGALGLARDWHSVERPRQASGKLHAGRL